jgi:hypothetical protein
MFLSKLILVVKTLFIIMVIIQVLAILSVISFGFYINSIVHCVKEEKIRLTSMDNATDAVWIERYCPTVGYSYKLYFVPNSEAVSASVPAIVKSHIDDIDMGWLSSDKFHMTYEVQARHVGYEKKDVKYELLIHKN